MVIFPEAELSGSIIRLVSNNTPSSPAKSITEPAAREALRIKIVDVPLLILQASADNTVLTYTPFTITGSVETVVIPRISQRLRFSIQPFKTPLYGTP